MASDKKIIHLDSPLLRYYQWDISSFALHSRTHMEIGFGNGQYIIDLARHHRDRNFFGIEHSRKYFQRVVKKCSVFGMGNVRLLCMEAETALHFLFPDRSIDVMHINFPDPWPKQRHRVRRLVDHSFVSEVRRVLKDGGEIDCASDYKEYFTEIVSTFCQHGFKKEHESDKPPQDRRFRTKYEKEFIQKGLPIYYCVLKKLTV